MSKNIAWRVGGNGRVSCSISLCLSSLLFLESRVLEVQGEQFPEVLGGRLLDLVSDDELLEGPRK